MLNALGLLQHEQGRLDEALACYEAARAVARELDDPDGVGSVLGNLGRLYLELGRVDEARVCLQDGERPLREVGDTSGLATLLGTRALLEARSGDRGAALAILAEVRDLADRIDVGSQAEVRRLLAQASAVVEGP